MEGKLVVMQSLLARGGAQTPWLLVQQGSHLALRGTRGGDELAAGREAVHGAVVLERLDDRVAKPRTLTCGVDVEREGGPRFVG
jgi:hypothetical protein